MSYDNWKTTNKDDEQIGLPVPPPCIPQRLTCSNGRCADCGAPEGECWWDLDDELSNEEIVGATQFLIGALLRDLREGRR